MKKLVSLLLALLTVASLAVPALATSGTVKFENKKITITPASNSMTTTDLFGNFKDFMPGDRKEQTVRLRNWALQYDYVTVYMEAKRHPKEELQTSDPEYGKDLVEMHDFLEKLDMTVKVGKTTIYQDSPDQEGKLSDPKKLGTIKRGKTMELDVELYWDPDQDYDYNKYADRVGEVDWVFYFEGHNYDKDSPKTGDYVIVGAAALMAVSGAALLLLFFLRKKRKN